MYDKLKYEVQDGIAILQINNAEKMNALSFQIIRDLGDFVSKIEADKSLRALVIWGNEKIFGAGADLQDVVGVKTVKEAYESAHRTHLIYNRIENLQIPTIAAIAGYALGACFELSLACDLRIASKKAKFGLPEISLGIMPGGGGSQRLAKLVGTSRAKELMFFGTVIDVNEAYRLGIVNRIVEVDTVFDEAMKMAGQFSGLAPRALEMIKAAVDLGCTMQQVPSMEHEARCFSVLFDTEDANEGITAFLEKRKPTFTGK